MKKLCLVALTALVLFSCKKEEKKAYKPSFTSVETDTLLTDSVISIRGLAIDGDKAWYAANRGKYGWVSLSGGNDFSGIAAHDTIFPEFRALAQTKENIFILSVGTPALLYKISKDGKQVKQVYTESGEKVFYDCMKFYNDNEGIAMGDPQQGCLGILTTIDGGNTWKKRDCTGMPKVVEGEAAFAASNTNIIIKNGKTWIVSGGKKSRVFYSPNKGKTWEVFDTPIVQGGEMTGIFSADFYDTEVGFAGGGNYEQPELNKGNKIVTTDGGKTWKPVGEGTGPGYISCVQFLPGSEGKELITVGLTGMFYSYDRGTTWEKIADATNLNTLQFADARTIIAAGQKCIVRFRLK